MLALKAAFLGGLRDLFTFFLPSTVVLVIVSS